MTEAFICAYVRTPIGRFGGSLSSVRADDLGAVPLKALVERNPGVDFGAVDDVIFGCANQAGEDNRNVARMSLLLAGLPKEVPGTTINRLCGSGMDAVIAAARAIKAGEAELMIAGGVESMSRAPFVLPKADSAFSRHAEIHDTTIGWRFVNPLMKAQYGIDSMPETGENVAADCKISRADQDAFALRAQYGIDSMPETGENVAADCKISRADQDAFALRSQLKAVAAQQNGRLGKEIVPVLIPQRKGDPIRVESDEHPRGDTTLEKLAKLGTPFRKEGGTVTAGNASGVNDGAAALIIASEKTAAKYGLTPIARVLGGATGGIAPRVMGLGPIPATRKLCERLGLKPTDFDVVELNEAFASQGIAVLRELGIAEDGAHVNPNGGAIALGHPLGMSGARITGTAALELALTGKRRALATMCIGVGQGIAVALERA
ncbi:thiolase family protein [Bosea beijingensis]|uniref:thiolase family protein n=1 Tax=Bosea beijingensis TaxID=3068632 RepID=UPI0027419940|nr:thiolase family protein [Bosea sp. REN20]